MDTMMLKGVRLSYPHLWTPTAFEEGQEKKFEATFIIPNDSKTLKQLKAEISRIIKEDLKGKKPKKSDYIPLRDQSDSGKEELENAHTLKAKTKEKSPPVILRGKTRILKEADDPLYAGCYVNAKIALNGYVHPKYGPMVLCRLIAVQFADDGEDLSGGHISEDEAVDGFEDIGDDDPEDDEDEDEGY